ncbi:MAG: Asp-tRNA(Asn)/Glu-tRNA(Gln) amidotransferase subunit GatC [Candidatus Paceibacterota bacterium]
MSKGALTKKDIEHLAKLSSLQTSEKETVDYSSQLSESLEYIRNLSAVDTKGVREHYYVSDEENKVRGDKVDTKRILSKKEAISQARKTKKGQFVVKRIL